MIGHELGHIAHDHPLKRVGWLALFLIPAAALVALLTRRRGGMARPEAVPVALLVFVALQLLATPLLNIVSAPREAEADWAALRGDPRTGGRAGAVPPAGERRASATPTRRAGPTSSTATTRRSCSGSR